MKDELEIAGAGASRVFLVEAFRPVFLFLEADFR